jgi:general secretion pathway protein A
MIYIRHRLWVAGNSGELYFEPDAVKNVFSYSKGSPRLINALCDNALLAGYVMKTKKIDSICIHKAIHQLEGTG